MPSCRSELNRSPSKHLAQRAFGSSAVKIGAQKQRCWGVKETRGGQINKGGQRNKGGGQINKGGVKETMGASNEEGGGQKKLRGQINRGGGKKNRVPCLGS